MFACPWVLRFDMATRTAAWPCHPPGAVLKVPVKNRQLLIYLRGILPGRWRKVYRKGQDGSEVHYFEHESGQVAGVKHKVGKA